MRIGLIARSDKTGLGNQTRNLARMLNPEKVLLVDSSYFNQNKQYPELYKDYKTTIVRGFPDDNTVGNWMADLDVVITCEIFYNMRFVDIAKSAGVKTINQYNWEFADYLNNPHLTLPDVLASPSQWNIDRARNLWGQDRVQYLPTPVFTDDFQEVREINYRREGHKRFLHIMGRQAINDRNGTMDLIQAMRYSKEDFELVIKAQVGDITHALQDSRITLDTSSPDNEVELYRDFDALILPRRYAGQCLPMAEALCAGLPVIMTDIDPNNKVLPPFWCISATPSGRFMARTWIDIYTADPAELGYRMDFLAKKDLRGEKNKAYNIGYTEYSNHVLKEKWEKLIESIV